MSWKALVYCVLKKLHSESVWREIAVNTWRRWPRPCPRESLNTDFWRATWPKTSDVWSLEVGSLNGARCSSLASDLRTRAKTPIEKPAEVAFRAQSISIPFSSIIIVHALYHYSFFLVSYFGNFSTPFAIIAQRGWTHLRCNLERPGSLRLSNIFLL